MQIPAQSRFTRTAVLLGVFSAGLVVGGLRTPMLAWAQPAATARSSATVRLVAMQGLTGNGLTVNNCADVSVIPVRPVIGNGGQRDAVIVVCERR
jgi:hypothetical protein